jgi:hypothetical protein
MTSTITSSVDPHPDILPNAITALWSGTSMSKEFWDVVQEVRTWRGAAITRDRRGLCLTLNSAQLGHLDWNGRLALPFGPEMQNQLVAEKMAKRDFDQADMEHAIIDVRTTDDVHRALWLLRFAYLVQNAKRDTCASVAS